MAQIMRPASQITATNGTPTSNVHLVLDGTAPDTGDYYAGNDNATGVCEVLLDDLSSTPPDAGTCTVTIYHAQCDGNSAPSSGGSNSNWDLEVYEGATQRAVVSGVSSNEGAFASYSSLTFSSTTITDWSDVRIRFTSNGTGGSPSGRRGAAISYAEISVPDTNADTDITTNTPPALATTTYNQTVQQAPRVWLNATQTKTGADEMTVTSWNTAGTSITFSDPSGGQTGSLQLGVENTASGQLGWIAVTVTASGTNVTTNTPPSLTTTTYAPSIDYDLRPGVASMTTSTHQATITFDVGVNAGTASLTTTTYPVTLTYDVNVNAGTAAMTTTPRQATLTFDVDVTTTPQALLTTTHPADVSLGVTIAAGVASMTTTTHQATLTYDVNVNAGTQTLTTSTHQASLAYDVDVTTTAPQALVTTTNPVTLTFDRNVNAGVASLTSTTHNPGIDWDLRPGTATLTTSTHQATVDLAGAADTNVVTNAPQALVTTTHQASTALDRNVTTSTPPGMVTSTYQTSTSLDRNVDATIASLTTTTYPVTLTYDVEIEVGLATLIATTHQASIDTGLVTYTNVQTYARRGML